MWNNTKTRIKNFIYEIVYGIVMEHNEFLHTKYSLYNIETGEKIDEHCSLSVKPAKNDILLCEDNMDIENHFRLKVDRVEYSATGLAGNIYGYVTPRQTEDFEGTDKAEMLDLLLDFVVMQDSKMLNHEMGVTIRAVEKAEALLKKVKSK